MDLVESTSRTIIVSASHLIRSGLKKKTMVPGDKGILPDSLQIKAIASAILELPTFCPRLQIFYIDSLHNYMGQFHTSSPFPFLWRPYDISTDTRCQAEEERSQGETVHVDLMNTSGSGYWKLAERHHLAEVIQVVVILSTTKVKMHNTPQEPKAVTEALE